jgi:TrmH family RNA methyltransferase
MSVHPSIVHQFAAARRDRQLAVLEGFHAIKHALRFGATLDVVVGTNANEVDHLAEALAPDIREQLRDGLQVVDGEVFSRLAPQAPPSGVMAIASRPPVDVPDVIRDRRARPIVLLEDPRNLLNLGACVRVAAAADAAGVLTTGPQDPWHPEALRAAAGLHFALPVAHVEELWFPGRPLVAVDPGGADFRPSRLPGRAVLAFGAERYGLSQRLLEAAHERIAIPMRSGVSSLNLATAVAAVLFAWRLAAGAHGPDA